MIAGIFLGNLIGNGLCQCAYWNKGLSWESFCHQETGKGYVVLTRGYRGYTCHVAISVAPIAPVA